MTEDVMKLPPTWKTTAREPGIPPARLVAKLAVEERAFSSTHAGVTINDGLFRFYTQQHVEVIEPLLMKTYRTEEIALFGFDWLARQYSLRGDSEIVVYDLGWNDALVADSTFADLIQRILPDEGRDLLREEFWESWSVKTGVQKLHYKQCVGYRVPVFLNGEDCVENLELVDMLPYLEVVSQLARQADQLPKGAEIGTIHLEGQ